MRVMVFGTFDRLHPGHVYVLQEGLKRGKLTVIVARDANVQRIKGKLPSQHEGDRVAAIRARFPAVMVLLGDVDDFLVPVRRLKPDVILLGYDQALPPGLSKKQLGARVERLKAYKPQVYKSSRRREEG